MGAFMKLCVVTVPVCLVLMNVDQVFQSVNVYLDVAMALGLSVCTHTCGFPMRSPPHTLSHSHSHTLTLIHTHTLSLSHIHIYKLTHSLVISLTHACTHPPTHLPTHSLTHLCVCVCVTVGTERVKQCVTASPQGQEREGGVANYLDPTHLNLLSCYSVSCPLLTDDDESGITANCVFVYVVP